jgi:hypothetical protein
MRGIPDGVMPWRDYSRMGAGIAGRYERCALWWKPHLELTRKFISSSLRPSKKIAVLGAGRLLDIDIHEVLKCCEEVHLFDLDPGAVAVWRAVVPERDRARVMFRCEDVTSCIREWSSQLRRDVGVGNGNGFFTQRKTPAPFWVEEEFDGVISLNLLGQIPLYWRDRAIGLLGPFLEQQCSPLEESMGDLQVAHLKAVTCGPSWSVIISDTDYYYYVQPASTWDEETALHSTASGVWDEIAKGAIKHESWWWHIAPQFVERQEYGEIHRVEAIFLTSDTIGK